MPMKKQILVSVLPFFNKISAVQYKYQVQLHSSANFAAVQCVHGTDAVNM
jgi:hypothetical protein